MEAFNFTVANEDCNLYTYDMRKLSVASCVHQVRPTTHPRPPSFTLFFFPAPIYLPALTVRVHEAMQRIT